VSPAPLAGRRVLVTRPQGRGQRLAERLGELGAAVELRPTIAFERSRRAEAWRERLARLDGVDWIVFTSPTGVRFFLEQRGRPAGGDVPGGLRVAAIGRGTARALEAAGLHADVVAADSRSEGLATELRRRCPPGARLLLVRPEVARDVLPAALTAAGLDVSVATLYRTVASAEAPAVARSLLAGRYDAVVFTSPSTFRLLLESAGQERGTLIERLRGVARVAIGEVTAAALSEAALPADAVAATPDEDAIADAVKGLLAR